MNSETLHHSIRRMGLSHFSDEIIKLARPCTRFRSSIPGSNVDEIGISKLGGLPDLPSSFTWPTRGDRPLVFVGQVNVEEVVSFEPPSLPKSGVLSLFYDVEESPWGYDPRDEGGGQLFYHPDVSELVKTASPDNIEFDGFSESTLNVCIEWSLPSVLDPHVSALHFSKSELEAYAELTGTVCSVQTRGWPAVIQNPMELECQLVSNGIYCGNATGYNDPRARQLAAGAADWTLLLQIDSDDNSDIMWGDCGRLYVWIRRHDLAEQRFDRTWTILQCY